MENPLLVFVTVPSQKEGERIGKKLVEQKLAACVNIIPHLYSIFSWQGKITEVDEILLLIKTMPDRFETLKQKIKKIHSYDVPEIIALPVVAGDRNYFEWVYESTRPNEPLTV
ncbi:MAG TPA: divalent-cation tolerance protein CutA [Bacteroidetes bacterium]|nr:divalent-cation tolerance protein CutA [Bacteroidota bacterium]